MTTTVEVLDLFAGAGGLSSGFAEAGFQPVGAVETMEDAATTYEALLHRARVALGMGESVVLDASWLDPTWRERAASVAVATSSDLTELCCETPAAVARDRLRLRLAAGHDPSDATPEVHDATRLALPSRGCTAPRNSLRSPRRRTSARR